MSRRIMNSDSLQNAFPDIYKNFFSQNDLILTTNFSLAWSPVGIGDHSSVAYIKQKLPTKSYVGISQDQGDNVDIVDVLFYDIVKDQYEILNFNDINKEAEAIENLIKEFCIENKISLGLKINVLCENTRGHGIGFSGTVGAAISAGLFLLAGKLTHEDLENYDEFMVSDLFKQVHNFAWQIDYVSRYGSTSGENSLFALHNSSGLLYFAGEEKTKDIKIQDLSNLGYSYFDVIERFAGKSDESLFPIDYALIFSGIATDTFQIEHYRKFDIEKDNQMRQFILENMKEFVEKDSKYGINKLSQKGVTMDWCNKTILILNVQFLQLLKEIVVSGYNINIIEELINHFNNYRYAVSLVEKQTNFAIDFQKEFYKNKSSKGELLGIMPVYTGKIGGGYLILMKQNSSRKTLINTVEALKSKYPDCAIEYSRWEDGLGHGGVQVQQHIKEGIFSEFVKEGNYYYSNNIGEKYIGDYEKIIKKESDTLLLDLVNQKIFLNGIMLTSKDIPSQTTTIEVLCALIENEGQEVSSLGLTRSSYTKSKNLMMGKIVIPIVRLLEKSFGKKLPLVCKGSLNDFYLKINKTTIKIGILRKI